MKDNRSPIEFEEGQRLLFDGSYRAIHFNVIMSAVLAISLWYNDGPKHLIAIWMAVTVVVCILRLAHCKLVLVNQLYKKSLAMQLRIFLLLCSLAGFVWASIYFISVPYTDQLQLYLIILVFGGMSAGAAATLGVFIPAFFVYTLSIFLPVIGYNYVLFDFNHSILATMFVLFLLAITIIAKSQQRLLRNVFFLTEQNQILREKFELLSITDPLTGLYNRRHFTKIFQDEYNRAKRNQQSFALASIDIDNFKLINDSFGHPFGDDFLLYMADYLKMYLRRANDIIFRLGGDEFMALLINIEEGEVKEACETIRNAFLKSPKFEYESPDSRHEAVLSQVSLSLGVVYVPYDSNVSAEEIIEQADKALYESKHAGKNLINYVRV